MAALVQLRVGDIAESPQRKRVSATSGIASRLGDNARTPILERAR